MLLRFLVWLALVPLLHGPCAVAAGKVTALIVFGDSSVDAGNNNNISTIAKSNFEPYGRDFAGGTPTGRFSNGRLPTDFISEAFGLPPVVPAYLDSSYGIKDFASGVCFASAGSGYDNATSDVLSVISMSKQLDYFKEYQGRLKIYQGEAKANETLSEALYIMSLGTNDFLENYYQSPRRPSEFTIEEYQNFLVGIAERFIISIYRLGARKLDLTGIPPMGCLPLERAMNMFSGSVCNEGYNQVAKDFNAKLQRLADRLNRKLHGMRISFANAYDIFIKVIDDPSSYGFENVGVGCCATGMFEMGYACNRGNPLTCSDAKKYVFWDAFHPTEKMYSVVADHIMKTALAGFM
ncbi:GDSL esterase/lipase-like [Iris pallida]|uniref:GDSL esterase/lipase-like n=1 Tax=Iris pallida TaxID=29817 RepID=A0AAX6GV36_IRIPA|nr:GDSL esterase/lipase-like [Iris pallida]